MSSAWLLPEHVADVLPARARQIEELRRVLLDTASSYGFELVMPPLLEHLDSLLSGAGHELDLRTFKLVDQLSGRTLGVRADSTPQVARIDAHLLNRPGVTRLCYCGPVLHTRPAGPLASREPLQFGAEIYGHGGLEADLEVLELALSGLAAAGLVDVVLDLSDARILPGLRAALGWADATHDALFAGLMPGLAAKDHAAIEEALHGLPERVAGSMRTLAGAYGGPEVLDSAAHTFPDSALLRAALADLGWLVRHLQAAWPKVRIGIDLGDVGGHAYYSGPRFAVYAAGFGDALIRGGRYDEVGSIFGRRRPAVGFSLDLKALVDRLPVAPRRPAIRAPWGLEPALREAVDGLRRAGETVVCVLPGHEHEVDEFACDRELVKRGDGWAVQSL